MATDDVTRVESPSAAAPKPREPAHRKAYEGRFSIAYLALAVIVAGAIIGFAIVWEGHNAHSETWSSWKPQAGGIDGSRQIADHVAARYRSADGSQLTSNLVFPFTVNQVEISRIAIRNDTRGADNKFYSYNFPTNVPYTLCGLGQRCAISTGKTSNERGRLVRREAFEAALYTFKYIKGSESVIEYLPPAPGYQLTNVLFLRKTEVAQALKRPFASSLPGSGPFTVKSKLGDNPAIDAMLSEHVFRLSYTQIPDGSVLAVLTPREIAS